MKSKRRPARVFHPGSHLYDEVMFQQIEDFSKVSGIDDEELSFIYHGVIPVSDETARKISKTLGTSSALWINLNNAYYDWIAEGENGKDR